MFGHAHKAQTATAPLSSSFVCHQLTVLESRSVKGGVEDTQERILSLCIVRTRPHLPTPSVRDFDETSGCGANGGLVGWWAGGLVEWWAGGLVDWWTGGLVGVLWIGQTVGIVELTGR